MRIQHNILAMNAYRNYNTNTSALAKNLEKLSSGYKINRAGDDAAGLAISEKMRAQITGLNAAQKNVKDGISLVKTAEGAMQEIQDMLNRMEYLATQSANGTYDNTVDRTNLQKEVDALKSEINRIADSANFNGINLLDGKTAKATSISALGAMDKDSMIDGTDPTAGGKAQVTVNMGGAAGTNPSLTGITASTDPAETFDGQAPSAATADVLTFTTNGNDTAFGGFTFSTAKTVTDIENALGGKYTVSVNGGGKTGATNLADDDVITLTAKKPGASGIAVSDVTNAKGQVDFTAGINEGQGSVDTKSVYSFELDTNNLAGGQWIELDGKKLNITAADNGTTIAGTLAINTNTALTDADIKTALGVFDKFDAEVSLNGTTGKATVTLTAKDANIGEAGNVGELTVSSNSSIVDSITHTAGQKAQPGTPGKQAQATFKSPDLALSNLQKVGTKFKFGSTTYEVVADTATNLTANQIKTGDLSADKVKELLAKEIGEVDHKTNVDYTADGVITLTGTDSKAGTVDALKNKTIQVANAPAAGTVAGNKDTSWKGLDIEVGKTTLDELKNHEIELDNGDTVKLGDLFDIKATNATAAISADSVITFEAKQTGKLSDKVMNAITYDKNAASEVRDGWDEGQTGAGNNTHYELEINTSSDKLAGGASFSFGTGSNIKTFDISYDGVLTGNGSIGTGKDEVGAGRVTIDLSFKMSAAEQAEAIKKAVSEAMGDFNVKTSVDGGSIKLEADAKTATADTNYGGVRFSSAGGAFSGGVYKAYNAFDGGTEGTYAQVGYEFDPSKLKAGDKVTIGGTTITVGEKDSTVKNDDGTVSITIAESKAQNADELISAFESAGFQSGQLEIADGKLTITGQQTGQTAEDLAKAMGVSVTSSRVLTTGGLTFQIGATADSFNQMTVSIGDMHTDAMGIADLDISLQDGAKNAIQTIKDAINYVSSVRGDLGATQNRLEHTANNLSVMAENIQDAESTIRDTDVAEEMMAYTKNNILIQSAQAMLAQANAVPQGVLQLLG